MTRHDHLEATASLYGSCQVARGIVVALACVLILAWARHECVTVSRVAP